MTNPSIPEVTDKQRRLARDWAEFIESSTANWTEHTRAAARVILNDIPAPPPPTAAKESPEMNAPSTPEVTDEDRRLARDWAEFIESHPHTWTRRILTAARVIPHIVPTPPTTA